MHMSSTLNSSPHNMTSNVNSIATIILSSWTAVMSTNYPLGKVMGPGIGLSRLCWHFFENNRHELAFENNASILGGICHDFRGKSKFWGLFTSNGQLELHCNNHD